jgi:hypothetical protein
MVRVGTAKIPGGDGLLDERGGRGLVDEQVRQPIDPGRDAALRGDSSGDVCDHR